VPGVRGGEKNVRSGALTNKVRAGIADKEAGK